MATQSKSLAHTRIASAGTDVVSKAAGLVTTCQRIILNNTSGSEVSVTVYFLRSGETVSSDGTKLGTFYVPAGKGVRAYTAEGIVLDTDGDDLHMVASVDDVIDCNVSGSTQ